MEHKEHLQLQCDTLDQLFNAYMPYVKHGGMFVATHKDYQIGDRIHLDINMMQEPRVYKVKTQVVWITPKGAQRGKLSGVGLQFIDDVEGLCKKIETHLAGKLMSSDPTATM